MRSPRTAAPRLVLALLLVALCVPEARAQDAAPAQAAPAPPSEPAPPEPSVAEVLGQAGDAEGRMRQIEARLAPDPSFTSIVERMPEHLAKLEESAGRAVERVEQATQVRQITDLETRWKADHATLEGWRSRATGRALATREAIAELDELVAVWKSTREEARSLGAAGTVTERIERTLELADNLRRKTEAERVRVLEVQAAISSGLATTADVLERIQRAQKSIRSGLLDADSQRIWTALAEYRERGATLEQAIEVVAQDLEVAGEYVEQQGPLIALHALLIGLSIAVIVALRPYAERAAREDEGAASSALVFARPFSAGVLVATVSIVLVYPTPPSYFGDFVLLLALSSALRVVPPLLEPGVRGAFYALAAFFAIDRVRDLLTGLPVPLRVLFEVELIGAIVVLALAMRESHLLLLPGSERLVAVYRLVRRLAIALLLIAFVSSTLGFVALSRLLGNGVLGTAYAGVALYAAGKVLAGVIPIALLSAALQRLNLVRNHRVAITRGATQLMRAGIWVFFAYVVLRGFGIWEPVFGAAVAILATPLDVGELQISLADVLVFAITIAIAVYLARFIRYALEEDVLPRLRLPRGVPNAVSTTTSYVVLSLGVLAAMAASGVDLSRFALLAGALGVGIGFGLQGVVNNFVSGLILLFERPIQTGDTIELGELTGEVKRIGIRSSTVRTWQGAEVIVPNAMLISEQVVNWTLSDRQRRIDIDVGVKYGTDPEQVLALLLAVAKADDRVLDQPEPNALFLGFGDSSLDFRLRAWTSQFSRWVAIRSDLTVEVNRALAEAGIEIPFPQRDLHLKSVAEELRNPQR